MDDVVCRHCDRIAEVRMTAEYLGTDRWWAILLCRVHFIEHVRALGVSIENVVEGFPDA